MKSLINGCAAAALLMGVAFQAHAEIAVRDAPVHTIPADADDAPDAAPAPVAEAAAPKAEPAAVKALASQPKPAPASLTAEENTFFTVLGQRVTDAASAYESYVRRAGAIDPAFSGAVSVQKAVKTSAAYHPVQLEEGIVAYAALVALRDQDFVDGVRAIQNPAFADDLVARPGQVMQVRGASQAAADVAGVLQAQGALLIAEGKAITKAAYDIQAQAWSKSPETDPKGMLDGAKASAGATRVATTPSKAKLLASLVTAPQANAAGSAPTPDVERGLALAALAILGKTGDGAEARYEALLHDASSEECLKMAKLNLNQCLAVAGPHYEDVYCAGRHAVSDTGKCIAAAAEGKAGDPAIAPPRLQEAVIQAPIQAPVQAALQAEPPAMGPEQAAAYGKPAPADEEADDDDDAAAPAAGLAAAPAPTLAAAQPAPAPATRQYAEAELQPAPQAAPPYAQPQYAPQPYAAPQRAEPMPGPHAPRQAPAYAQQQPYSYAQNDYAAAQAPPAPYGQAYAQPPYPQYQQQPYQPPYQPSYPQQPQYAPQGYQPPYQPAPAYAPQQPYYPQQQGYSGYQPGGYYGR